MPVEVYLKLLEDLIRKFILCECQGGMRGRQRRKQRMSYMPGGNPRSQLEGTVGPGIHSGQQTGCARDRKRPRRIMIVVNSCIFGEPFKVGHGWTRVSI